jgi:hypothetical protein
MLKSTSLGNPIMNPKNQKSPSGLPNWIFYSGIGFLLSAGAVKIALGLLRLYR